MFTDFRDSDAPERFDCDLAIVGAGAAGITMALRLADSGLRICLIESGGLEYDDAVQSLYDGESVGRQLASPLQCRLRYFGGTTNHWAGWCAPLAEIDFQARSWVPDSGWPISKSELDPYYEAAQPILELGPYRYEAGQLPTDADMPRFDTNTLRVRSWQYSPPTRFRLRYREDLAASDNVEVVLHANVVRIQTNATATQIEAVHLETLTGRAGSVRARIFVLACGGMENTRLLLQTQDVDANGLGNGSGMLGRFFMQHPEHAVADIVTNDTETLVRAFDRRSSDIGPMRAHLTTSADCQQRFELLNAGFDLRPQRGYSAAYTALRGIVVDVGDREWPSDLDAKLWSVLTDLDGVAGDLYRRARGEEVVSFELLVHSEQAPNPESRLTLSRERDRFGMPKLRVDWRLAAGDKRSIRESALRVGEELARLKLGRMKLREWMLPGDDSWPDPIWSGCHHMGTTRMSDDPDAGIVDRNCRAHSVRNLYVAGSSVFPTGGYVPPTFTIVALALRMADHMKGELG
jgi:choline dehydrogenase-like flavoprotein